MGKLKSWDNKWNSGIFCGSESSRLRKTWVHCGSWFWYVLWKWIWCTCWLPREGMLDHKHKSPCSIWLENVLHRVGGVDVWGMIHGEVDAKLMLGISVLLWSCGRCPPTKHHLLILLTPSWQRFGFYAGSLKNLWVILWQIVLGSPVQSSLLSKFDKTGTWTSPHKLKNLEKLDWTNVNWFSAVLVGFLWLKDWSQPVSVSTGWGLVLWWLTMYIIENLYYWAWYYNKVIPHSVSGEGGGVGGECLLSSTVTAMSHCHHLPLSIIVIIHPSPLLSCGRFHLLLLSCCIIIGGRGRGGDVAVVGSGQCHCVRVILWLFSFVVIVMSCHHRWQRARGWHGSGWQWSMLLCEAAVNVV